MSKSIKKEKAEKAGMNSGGQKELVRSTNDNKIDQDFSGFPHGHAKESIINPKSEQDKKTAAVHQTDGEKMNRKQIKKIQTNGTANSSDARGKKGK